MGTVAIQTQCCLYKRDEEDDLETDDEAGAREGTAVQLVEPVPWHLRPDRGPPGAPPRSPAAVPRSLKQPPSSLRAKGRPIQICVNVTLSL